MDELELGSSTSDEAPEPEAESDPSEDDGGSSVVVSDDEVEVEVEGEGEGERSAAILARLDIEPTVEASPGTDAVLRTDTRTDTDRGRGDVLLRRCCVCCRTCR